jgi:UDP-glucose:(heptosyl)LPS alpha-1,3-glucosyltransferase
MRIAFGIFRLAPTGGLERNAITLARMLTARGHRVALHATRGLELVPAGVDRVAIAPAGWSNHGRQAAFSARYAAASGTGFDLVVGFQKLAGLDLLYCADWCFVDRPRPAWQRLLPRYRVMARLERACFGAGSRTRIIGLAQPQLDAYLWAYATPRDRLALLPPTVEPGRRPAAPPTGEARAALRGKHGLDPAAVLWLWIGLQPRVKGLDRVVAALGRHPEARLLVCGPGSGNRQLEALLAAARRAGFADRIRLFGMVSDGQLLGELFAAADLLVHPARLDVTGTVILEAIVNGLPVITTANCGYSSHVVAADAGVVLPASLEPASLEATLAAADTAHRARWSANAFAYGRQPALFSGLPRAADLIEAAGRRDEAGWAALALADPLKSVLAARS